MWMTCENQVFVSINFRTTCEWHEQKKKNIYIYLKVRRRFGPFPTRVPLKGNLGDNPGQRQGPWWKPHLMTDYGSNHPQCIRGVRAMFAAVCYSIVSVVVSPSLIHRNMLWRWALYPSIGYISKFVKYTGRVPWLTLVFFWSLWLLHWLVRLLFQVFVFWGVVVGWTKWTSSSFAQKSLTISWCGSNGHSDASSSTSRCFRVIFVGTLSVAIHVVDD